MDNPTDFAPARRAPFREVADEYATIRRTRSLDLINQVPFSIIILNDYRQVVFANAHFLQTLCEGEAPGPDVIDTILGQRPGEILGCVNAGVTSGGCGTTEFCRHCGAVGAILSAIDGQAATRTCQLLQTHEDAIRALDLLVSTVPFVLDERTYTLFCVSDISDQTRREALERLFFHDLLNITSGIEGVLQTALRPGPEYGQIGGDDEADSDAVQNDDTWQGLHLHLAGDEASLVQASFRQMVDLIVSQRDLLAAEDGDLTPHPMRLEAEEVLEGALALYATMAQLHGVHVQREPGDRGADAQKGALVVRSDYTLLSRVLGNMLKNAIEASQEGDTVRAGVEAAACGVRFWVHNAAHMPEEVRLQVFKRSFSTKGRGRGLGTYSMKLLSERYLGGEVGFSTAPGEGTRFYLCLPAQDTDADTQM